jgi:HupE / UreJ protein
MFRPLLIWLVAALLSPLAWAHKTSDAYLLLQQSAPLAPIQAQLAVALRDLNHVFNTPDANNDSALSFSEIEIVLPAIEQWATLGVLLRCGPVFLPLTWRYEAMEQRSDGVFVRLAATSAQPCDTRQAISMRYSLMQEVDADHRAVVSFLWQQAGQDPGKGTNTQGSAAIQPSDVWKDIANQPSAGSAAGSSNFSTLESFVILGIEHIGSGADHIAFIICLVLTLSLGLASEQKSAWKALLITITAFTLGHSITLISATLGWVGSPSWVEPVIALSIAASAAFNLIKQRLPVLQKPAFSAALAAGFGLVHGLGFSGAMTEAQLPEGALLWALAGFNIGVELGQLLIIAAWSLVYWALHRWAGYPRWIVQGGSVALIMLSSYWFFERLGVLL